MTVTVADTSASGLDATYTTIVDTASSGTTDWSSESSGSGSHSFLDTDTLDPNNLTAGTLLGVSSSTETYADESSGTRHNWIKTTSLVDFYHADPAGLVSDIDSSDVYEETSSFDWSSSASGGSTFSDTETLEDIDADSTVTLDERQLVSVWTIDDDYAYAETNGNRVFSTTSLATQEIHGTKDSVTTDLSSTDSYGEAGTADWTLDQSGTSTLTFTDLFTTIDNWETSAYDEENSTYASSSHDFSDFDEAGWGFFSSSSVTDLDTHDFSETDKIIDYSFDSSFVETDGRFMFETHELVNDWLYTDETTLTEIDFHSFDERIDQHDAGWDRRGDVCRQVGYRFQREHPWDRVCRERLAAGNPVLDLL